MSAVTLFSREGCRPCDVVTPIFVRAQMSNLYTLPLMIKKFTVDDEDIPVPAFPTVALTDADGAIARLKDKQPAAPPLIGGSAVQKGLSNFLYTYGGPKPIDTCGDF